MNKLAPLAMILGGLLLAFGNVEGCDSLPLPIMQRDYPGSWIVVVEETQERTPEMAKVCGSDYWDELEKRELKYRFYDDDSDDAKPYLDVAKSIPWLIIQNKDGRVLTSQKLPTSIAELDKVVKGTTGR